MRGEESAALDRVDVFAAGVLARVEPLSFGIARTREEREAVFRLRCAVVLDQSWGRAEDFPDGLEQDVFDERAIHVVAWDGAEIVGTTRLVAPATGHLLPTEQAFGLEIADRGQVIDKSRTCRAPGRNDPGQRIFCGLLSQAWIELRARGFSEICCILSPSMTRFNRRLGFRVEILGEARVHWGAPRHPVLVRPADTINNLRLGG